MDINKQWRELEQAKFSHSQLNKEIIMQAIHTESKSTITLLKSRLKVKINWIKFFLICFAALALFYYNNLAIIFIMIGAITIYSLGFWMLWRDYKKLGVSPNFENSALQHMKDNLTVIRAAIKNETMWGFIIMPSGILGGVALSGLVRGKSVGQSLELLSSWSYVLFVVVLAAVAMFLAIKANDSAFGQHIKQLEKQIKDLEAIE